jgi:hypothetical protein
VVRGLARTSRLRAVALRERGEATAERARALHDRRSEQLDRLSEWTQKAAARVHAGSRSDAVALAALLAGYRWYLIVPDEEHWEVVVEFTGDAGELPKELRDRIGEWLSARGLPSARVRLGDAEIEVYA